MRVALRDLLLRIEYGEGKNNTAVEKPGRHHLNL